MRKYILLLILILTTSSLFAQQERANFKNVSTRFVAFFNTNKNDSIVAMFSPEMNAALPFEKFSQVTMGLKAQLGDIMQIRFVRSQSATALYETTFEKATLAMSITLNATNQIAGLLFKPYSEAKVIVRNTTKMQVPFKGEWSVTWGGDTKELNYHVESVAQKNAFDILIRDNTGSTHRGDGQKNEDYYAFGKELYAPCDGEVVLVVDGVKDNVPGTLNPVYVPGNTVIIKTNLGEYVFFAHFKQHSIVVKQGQKVKVGELLGLCGNSGNSSEPHLHFHLQNVEDMNLAVGAKCYFEKIKVNGELKIDYSPIKGDKIEEQNSYVIPNAVVQTSPVFPGGESGWVGYLEKNLNKDLPYKNGAPVGKYEVEVSFIISKDGSVLDAKAINDPGFGLANEAIRVLEQSPKWKPATQNGRNIIYRNNIIISFEVK
jgi:murein DD-endopeptidase MepM/ murein hydrolase activator NlpD